MVDTITYRIQCPDGSYVDEPVDLPPSVAIAISSLMRMHGGHSAAPVSVSFATHVARGPLRPPNALVPLSDAPGTIRNRLRVAAVTGMGVAMLCGVLLARAIRSTPEPAAN